MMARNNDQQTQLNDRATSRRGERRSRVYSGTRLFTTNTARFAFLLCIVIATTAPITAVNAFVAITASTGRQHPQQHVVVQQQHRLELEVGVLSLTRLQASLVRDDTTTTTAAAKKAALTLKVKNVASTFSSLSAKKPSMVKEEEKENRQAVAAATTDAKEQQYHKRWAHRLAMLAFPKDISGSSSTSSSSSNSPVLLFDGVCNLCNDAVNFCLDYDIDDTEGGNLRFASLQSAVGQALLVENGRDPNDRSTMVLVKLADENNENIKGKNENENQLDILTGSCAVLYILANHLKGLPKSVRVAAKVSRTVVPAGLRDAVLKLVSENRHLMGQTDGPTCRLDFDGIYEQRFLEDFDLE